ncbi:MAG: hypothetical protein ABI693_03830 [Bryobacteraceae bacterium]
MPEQPLRQGLLARLPLPVDAAEFRRTVEASVAEGEKRIRRERILVTLFWVFCVVSAVAYVWFSPGTTPAARAPFLACLFFLWGGIEVLKHHINAARTDLKAQIKQLQVQLLELQKSR